MPAIFGRRLEKAVNRGIGAEERRSIPVRQVCGQIDAEAGKQRIEIAAPRNRHGDVADRVLEDQIPADDPGHQLAQRRVRIRVRASRLRNHRRELRVAERRQPAHDAEQDEREDERRPGAVTHDLARRQDLAGRRGADRRKDARADHRADGEHDQIPGAHDASRDVPL